MSADKQSESDHYGKIIGIYLLLIFAIIAIAIGSYSMYDRWQISHNGISTEGFVYEIEHATNTDIDVLVFKVRFNYQGHDYYFHNDNMTIDNRYRLHEKLKVMFLKDSPEKAIINDSREDDAPGPAIFLIIGFALLAFAIYLLRAENKMGFQIK